MRHVLWKIPGVEVRRKEALASSDNKYRLVKGDGGRGGGFKSQQFLRLSSGVRFNVLEGKVYVYLIISTHFNFIPLSYTLISSK